jgi:NTE family protein
MRQNVAMKRGLVLGGGGLVGIAWEIGVLTGLANKGFHLTGPKEDADHRPDVILGTSAGSVVGAMMGATTLAVMQELSRSDDSAAVILEVIPTLDFELMGRAFGAWQKVSESDPSSFMTVAQFAAEAKSIDQERFVSSMTDSVGTTWPDSRFSCFAVDTATGELQIWDEQTGVSVDRAVASSCSVPSMFPPITITSNGRTSSYTDGGVRSGTSLHLAAGADRILVLAPIGSWKGETLDASAARAIVDETAIAEAAGSQVITLFTDDETNQATMNTPLTRMDPAGRAPALEHGIRQGEELAAQLEGWWR